jgi:hypothetical protein
MLLVLVALCHFSSYLDIQGRQLLLISVSTPLVCESKFKPNVAQKVDKQRAQAFDCAC